MRKSMSLLHGISELALIAGTWAFYGSKPALLVFGLLACINLNLSKRGLT